jgi:ribose/xylose/arabinose/galactoside ABC-type transport system permease subunit
MTAAWTATSSPALKGGAAPTVAAAGVAGAIACAGVVAGWFLFADISRAAAALEPVTVVACLIAGAAFGVLAVALPGLATRTRLPRIPVTLAALACAFIATPAWTFGTVVPHLAAHTSPARFDELGHVDFRLLLLNVPMITLSLAGFASPAWTARSARSTADN